MKRILFESIKTMPYTPDQPVNRLGALSSVLGIQVSAADPNTVATITVSHCDTVGGTYAPVLDERLFLDNTIVGRDSAGKITQASTVVPVAAGELLNLDIDLIGCDQFVKINAEYSAAGVAATVTATYALTLGDYNSPPLEA